MMHQEYIQELQNTQNTEHDIKQVLNHIDDERAAIEEIRETAVIHKQPKLFCTR
jgi:hypothetical protein